MSVLGATYHKGKRKEEWISATTDSPQDEFNASNDAAHPERRLCNGLGKVRTRTLVIDEERELVEEVDERRREVGSWELHAEGGGWSLGSTRRLESRKAKTLRASTST